MMSPAECVEMVGKHLPEAHCHSRNEGPFFWVFAATCGREFLFEVTPDEVGVSEITQGTVDFTGHDEAMSDFPGALRWVLDQLSAGGEAARHAG